MKTKVVCVFNNQEIFDKVVKNNENLSICELFSYDNTDENIPVTLRYNEFLNLNTQEESWFVFVHQDFGFLENINEKLQKLSKNAVYGAVGVKFYKGLFFGKKNSSGKLGFKTQMALTWGRIKQGNNDFNFKKHGRFVFGQKNVDAVDCCCIIVHSSLINKYGLRFDENLSFHMYAEDLCYRAKQEFNIPVKVIQTNCFHLGKGKLDKDFMKSAEYLKRKFNIKRIPSTCIN